MNAYSGKITKYIMSMGLGFRFLPGQTEYKYHDLTLPAESNERYSLIQNSLGFSFVRKHLFTERKMLPYSSSGTGLRGLVNETSNKTIVEVVTFYKGWYWRFIILVNLGIGCAVWFMFAPGTEIGKSLIKGLNANDLFAPFESYEPF